MPKTAREVAEGRKVKTPKKDKGKAKKKAPGFVGAVVEGVKAYGKKIESAMEERTGSKSMRKKHRRKKK